jgi:PAS domain S-box-containing protein
MSRAHGIRLSQLPRYLAGLAAVGLTFFCDQLSARYLGLKLPPYSLFYPAITLAALLAGFSSGLLATAFATLLIVVWVLPPQGQPLFHSYWGFWLGLFVSVGVLSSAICEVYRRTRKKLAEYERQLAGQKTQEALRRYELLAENSRDIILFVKRGGGQILEANAAAELSYGYTRQELLGMTIHDLRAPESKPLSPQQLAEADRRGIRFEGVQRRKDGSTFPVEVSSQGAVLGDIPVLISVIRDMTERIAAEQAIEKLSQDMQRRAEELQAVFDAAPIGLAICQDTEGLHIRNNPANERLLGLTSGDELSLTSPGLARYRVVKDGRELSMPELPMQRAVRGESVKGAMLDIVQPDREAVTLYACAVPLFDEKNKPRGAVGAFLDMTPLKMAQEALLEVSEHRRLAMEGAGLGCWSYKLGGEVSLDEHCRKMFGFSGTERISREAILACVHREDRRAVIGAFFRAVVGDGVFQCDFRVITSDGSLRWLANHARVHCEGHKLSGMRCVGVLLDITERRRAAMRQDHEWLRVTLTSIGDAVIAADTDCRITFMNPAASAITGWTSEVALGRPIESVFRIFNQETGTEAPDIVRQVLEDGRIIELTTPAALMARDGRLVPIEDSAAPIRNKAGKTVGVVLVFHDVTEKVRAQKAVRQSQERYRLLVDISPIAIYVNRGNRIEFVNPAAVRLLGASSPEEILGKSPYDIFHPDSHPSIRERIEHLRAGESVPLVEHKIVRLDGRILEAEVTASPFVDENGTAIQVMMHDITGRRQREEQAWRFNRTLKALNSSNQALLRATSEQGLLQQVCRIITEDCGHPMVWIGLAENDERKSVRPAAYAGFEEGSLENLGVTWADTERGCGPTGTAIRTGQLTMCLDMLTDPQFAPWREKAVQSGFRAALSLPLMNEGKAFGAITIYSTVTGAFSPDEISLLKELASDLSYGIAALRLRAAHELAQGALIRSEKLASVGRMAATIAHEINNPLAAVMNTLYLARGSGGLSEQARQYLDICDAELRRVSHITRQALGFYRESTAPAMTSIGLILDSVLDLLGRKISDKRVTVERQYDKQLQIKAVAGELRQVFSNLVSNSLDAVADGGTIKLRVSSRNGTIRVTVADNGDGISAAILPHIFEPFFTTKDAVGTGLGLWVSKQIVEKHGGSIRLHSSTSGQRRGTAFSIVLPPQPGNALVATTAGN